MSDALVRACPICSGTAVTQLHTQRFILPDGHPLRNGYAVVCCDLCGFVYADSAATQAEYDAFYAQESKYEDPRTSTGGADTPQDAARVRAMVACIRDRLPSTSARLLDMGCANGGLLDAFAAAGYTNLVGVDPSAACVGSVRRKGMTGVEGSLFHLPPGLGRFDFVVLSHVLEHVRDVCAAVTVLADLLEPNGVIYVEVPDASRYVEFLVAPFQEFNTEHINHFSTLALRNLMAAHGFEAREESAKLVDMGLGMPYPCIWGMYSRSAAPPVIEADRALGRKIESYVTASRALLDGIERILKRELARWPDVIVWGTGQLTLKLLAETALGSARIRRFVDGNPIHVGKTLHGVKVVSPDDIGDELTPIVIGSTLHHNQIAHRIRHDLKRRNPLIFLAEETPTRA